MRVWTTLLLAAAVLAGPALARADDPEAHYQALLTQATAAKPGDPSVDWAALRFAYADRPSFNVMGDQAEDALQKAMFQALTTKDYPGAVAKADQILGSDYVDADAHLILAICAKQTGDDATADAERTIALSLWKSIETGDGSSAAAAFTVIDVAEEYSLMRAKGRRVTQQALVASGGHSYDVLSTIAQGSAPAGSGAAPAGDPRDFYFLIDRVLAAENAMLKAGR